MRIGELSKMTGVAASALRYYEQEGLLPPAKRTGSGYRVYDQEAIDRIRVIQMAQHLGFPLDAIRSVFAEGGFDKEDLMARLEGRLHEIDGMVKVLRAQRRDLLKLQDTLRQSWSDGKCVDPNALAQELQPGQAGVALTSL